MARDERYDEVEFVQTVSGSAPMPSECFGQDITPIASHYVLTHFRQPLEAEGARDEEWEVSFQVMSGEARRMTLAQLKALPCQREEAVTLECAGNGRALMRPRKKGISWRYGGVSTALWSGADLRAVLAGLGLEETLRDHPLEALELRFFGRDRGLEPPALSKDSKRPLQPSHYSFGVPLARVWGSGGVALLAHTMNGQSVPLRHGAPLRAVVAGAFGMACVKHVTRVVVQPRSLRTGYWQDVCYHYFAEAPSPAQLPRLLLESRPVLDILVKSAFSPPGLPVDLHPEDCHLLLPRLPADVPLCGRAWSGVHPISLVQWRPAGQEWADADIRPLVMNPASAAAGTRFAWVGWHASWRVQAPGRYALQVCATNAVGDRQPDVAVWNYGGFGNNSIQTIHVSVHLSEEELD